jgi:uncharacterized membrane protein YecN with MAPEG domain
MLLPIALTLAAAAALLNFWLAVRISRIRMAEKVLHGDGGNTLLHRRMRAQANFIEYCPIVLILFTLVELAIGSTTWLWVLALVFVLGRVAHAFGMDSDKANPWRAGGIMITFATLLILSGAALYAAYGSMRELPVPPSLVGHV